MKKAANDKLEEANKAVSEAFNELEELAKHANDMSKAVSANAQSAASTSFEALVKGQRSQGGRRRTHKRRAHKTHKRSHRK